MHMLTRLAVGYNFEVLGPPVQTFQKREIGSTRTQIELEIVVFVES